MTEGEDAARFTMLETIREYALERLAESGEEQTIRWRHAGLLRAAHGSTDSGFTRAASLRSRMSWIICAPRSAGLSPQAQSLPGLITGRDFQFWGERTNEGRRWLEHFSRSRSRPATRLPDAWYGAPGWHFSTHDYASGACRVRNSLPDGEVPGRANTHLNPGTSADLLWVKAMS